MSIIDKSNFAQADLTKVNFGILPDLVGHSYYVTSVAFSPDGLTVVSGSSDEKIKLWNVETGQEIKTLVGHVNDVTSVVFSPDGKTVVSGSWDNKIKLWSVETGQ